MMNIVFQVYIDDKCVHDENKHVNNNGELLDEIEYFKKKYGTWAKIVITFLPKK